MRYEYTTKDIPISELDLLKRDREELLRYESHRIIYRDDELFCVFCGHGDIFHSVINYSERYFHGVDYWFSWDILKDFSEYLKVDKDFCKFMENDEGYSFYYEQLEDQLEWYIKNIKEEEEKDIFDIELLHDPFWWSDYSLGNYLLPKFRKELEGLREGKECIIKHRKATGIDIIYKESGKSIFRYNLEDIVTGFDLGCCKGYVQAVDRVGAKEKIKEEWDIGNWKDIGEDYVERVIE